MSGKPIRILLVEDSPADIRLTREVLKDERVRENLSVVQDGVEALAYLKKEGQYENAPRPDLILLDLNLPRKDGRAVLSALKSDANLRKIPVVVLTTSQDQQEVHNAYDLNANCFITKPVDLEEFTRVIKAIEDFWLSVAELPRE